MEQDGGAGDQGEREPAEAFVSRCVAEIGARLDRTGASSLNLALREPRLGDLAVRVEVRGQGVSARFTTGDGRVARALRDLRPSLVSGLAARGLGLSDFQVEVRR